MSRLTLLIGRMFSNLAYELKIVLTMNTEKNFPTSLERFITAFSFTCVDAKVFTQLQSQHRNFPCLYANIVMPFGFLLSSLERPGGFSGHGAPDVWRALLTSSFNNSACLASLPALSLHARLWRSSVLTLATHLQTCGSHTGAPILRETNTVKMSASSRVPNEGTGMGWSHKPNSDSAAASNLALFNCLDSSKCVSNLASHKGSSQLVCLRLESAVGRSAPPFNLFANVPASNISGVDANSFTRDVKASTKDLVACTGKTNAGSERSTARINLSPPKQNGSDAWLQATWAQSNPVNCCSFNTYTQ